MADVARVLVVQIDQHPPEVGRLAGVGGELRRLVETPDGEHPRHRGTGALHSAVPVLVELFGELSAAVPHSPLGIGVEVDRVPRRSDRLPGRIEGGVFVLDEGEVLEQAAQGNRRRRVRIAEPNRVPAARKLKTR